MAKTSPRTDNSRVKLELRKKGKRERERAGLTSVVEETQVGKHEPPLLPQLHSCTVLKNRTTELLRGLTLIMQL